MSGNNLNRRDAHIPRDRDGYGGGDEYREIERYEDEFNEYSDDFSDRYRDDDRYRDGLNDAWECAKKIVCTDSCDRKMNNIFDDDFYLLDKVIFETKVAGADYELYLVPEANGKPSADVSGWKLLGSGTTGYSGYTCADIENVELTDSTASIAENACVLFIPWTSIS